MTSDEGVFLGLVSFFFPVRRHAKPKISWYFTRKRFTRRDIRSKSEPTPCPRSFAYFAYVLHMLYSAAVELSLCVGFWILMSFESNFKRAFYQYLLTIDTSNQQLSSILIIAKKFNSVATELILCVSFWILESFESNFKRAFYQYLLTIDTSNQQLSSILIIAKKFNSVATELILCVSFWILESFESNFKRAFYQYLLTIDTSNQQLSHILIITKTQRQRRQRVFLFPVRWYENPEISCYFTTKRYSCRDIRQQIILHERTTATTTKSDDDRYWRLEWSHKRPRTTGDTTGATTTRQQILESGVDPQATDTGTTATGATGTTATRIEQDTGATSEDRQILEPRTTDTRATNNR